MSQIKRVYLLKIKKEDKSNLTFLKLNKVKNLPTTVDLRPRMPVVFDQGELGSCTAQALCALISFLNPQKPLYSRLFLYYVERLFENNVSIDSGASLSDGIKALEQFGVCRETSWYYNINNFAVNPPNNCYVEAALNKVDVSQTINIGDSLGNLKTALNQGHPFVCGISIYASFESQVVAETGIVSMPKKGEQFLGGHAILIVGYNEKTRRWIARNSWGSSWGDKGYFYLPYAYLLNNNLCSDFWTIKPNSKK
jgi:C1A family cysteine protease